MDTADGTAAERAKNRWNSAGSRCGVGGWGKLSPLVALPKGDVATFCAELTFPEGEGLSTTLKGATEGRSIGPSKEPSYSICVKKLLRSVIDPAVVPPALPPPCSRGVEREESDVWEAEPVGSTAKIVAMVLRKARGEMLEGGCGGK